MTAGLTERLRNETRSLHTGVERSTLMRALLRGELGLLPYCMLLRNLHPIYVALEAALTRHARQPLLAPIFASALFRSAALEQDLNTLHGRSWDQAIALQPASRLYVDQGARVGPNRLRSAGGARLCALPGRPERRPVAQAHRGKKLSAVRQGRYGLLRIWRFGSDARADAGISRRTGRHQRGRRPDRR